MKASLITILRDSKTNLVDFRRATHKLASILAAEAAAHLGYEQVQVQTPLASAKGVKYQSRLILAPVLRSGLALLPSFLQFFDDALVGMIGAQRDEVTAIAHGYYCKLPAIHPKDDVIILDPMIATGGSGVMTLKAVRDAGAAEERIIFASVIAAPEGLASLKKEFPKVCVITAQIDERLNDRKYILPGLGDFGDRFFGTCSPIPPD